MSLGRAAMSALRTLGITAALLVVGVTQHADSDTVYQPVRTQFIAALASPTATRGTGAEAWGLWRVDPGPRGVRLANYQSLKASGGVAPASWTFNSADWWLEENGLIMESPAFGLEPGEYVVTGNREVVTVLTIHPKDANGVQRWELANGATIYDVTHLRCRSARYTPAAGNTQCSPENAPRSAFPVTPGADMPPVPGCSKQDYAVLFIVGVGLGD